MGGLPVDDTYAVDMSIVGWSVVGQVVAIHRYPLKSAAGESLPSCRVDGTGLQGDRGWALSDGGGVLDARKRPELAAWRARVRDGRLEVDPGGGFVDAGDPATRLGAAQVVQVEVAAHQVAAVHVVSAHAPVVPGCDADPRANLVLELEPPGVEREWVGRQLLIGDLRLQLTRLPKRCLGVYGTVGRPGTVTVGDEVRLVE